MSRDTPIANLNTADDAENNVSSNQYLGEDRLISCGALYQL